MNISGSIYFNKPNPPLKQEGKKEEEKLELKAGENKVEVVKKDDKSEKQKLEELINKNALILYKTSTVFPFDLFPDTLIIYTDQISLITREFFFSGRTSNTPIEDLADVKLDVSIIFAKLSIVEKGAPGNLTDIRFLWRDQALKAHSILQGLIVGQKKKIDFSKIKTPDLVDQIRELGKTRSVD